MVNEVLCIHCNASVYRIDLRQRERAQSIWVCMQLGLGQRELQRVNMTGMHCLFVS